MLPTKTKNKDFLDLKKRFEIFSKMETIHHMDHELIPKLNELF